MVPIRGCLRIWVGGVGGGEAEADEEGLPWVAEGSVDGIAVGAVRLQVCHQRVTPMAPQVATMLPHRVILQVLVAMGRRRECMEHLHQEEALVPHLLTDRLCILYN